MMICFQRCLFLFFGVGHPSTSCSHTHIFFLSFFILYCYLLNPTGLQRPSVLSDCKKGKGWICCSRPKRPISNKWTVSVHQVISTTCKEAHSSGCMHIKQKVWICQSPKHLIDRFLQSTLSAWYWTATEPHFYLFLKACFHMKNEIWCFTWLRSTHI